MFESVKNERRLLEASRKGNTEAFGVLVGRYQSLVCAITYSGTGSVDTSEELAQEAFLRAWRSLGQLKDPARFRAWLSRIARSTVLNWYRSHKRDVVGRAVPLDAAADRPSGESEPAEAAMAGEQQIVVGQALARIPDNLREPLVLFYREDKSVREVARQLNLTENAARQRISRGRKMLREQVAHMVETTITETRPDKAFTAAVVASIATLGAKAPSAAAGVSAAEPSTTTGGSTSLPGILTGTGGKVAALVAAAMIIAGAIVAHKQFTRPPEPSQQPPAVEVAAPPQSMPIASTTPDADEPATTAIPDVGLRAEESQPAPGTEELSSSVPEEARARPRSFADPGAGAFEFKPKGVLSGLITDAETGEPVRDARLDLRKGRIFHAETDANGFYCFEKVHEPGSFSVTLTSNEYVGFAAGEGEPVVNLEPGAQVVRHFQLPRACMVDVWVVDANGAGIEDARVVATSLVDSRGREINDSTRMRTTDPNGYILLGGFPPAQTEYLVTAWHSIVTGYEKRGGGRVARQECDYAPARTTVRLTDPNVVRQLEIVLHRGQEVHGYAEYADGVPVSGLDISATPSWWHCLYGVGGSQIGDDGMFTFKHVLPGTYDIAVHFPTSDTGHISRTVMQAQLPPADGEPLMVQLDQKSPESLVSISGTIRYRGEKRPSYLWITTISETGSDVINGVVRKSKGSLADTFTVAGLSPGTHTLEFYGDGIERTVVRDVSAPSTDLEVELIYQAEPTLTGSVVDARTGEPVTEFKARVRKVRHLRRSYYTVGDKWIQFEDQRGRFSLETVGPGVYEVQVHADAYAPASSEQINTDELRPVTVALSAGGTIAGMVLSETGQPISGARVTPLSVAGGVMPDTKDAFASTHGSVETTGGRFNLPHLPPGTETLRISHPDHALRIVEQIPVVEGQTTAGIEVILTQGGTVEGVVYDEQGRPKAGQLLQFMDQSGYRTTPTESRGLLGSAVTDANGFYRVAHLPEQFCYVKRADYYRSLGVARRVIVPRNGRTLRLDFGGLPLVSGTAIVGGTPLARTKLRMVPIDTVSGSTFLAYASTDPQGGFVLGGAPPGTYCVSYENRSVRGRWVRLGLVTVADNDVEMGVVPRTSSKLLITLKHGDGWPWASSEVFVQDGPGFWSERVGRVDRPEEPGDRWVVEDLEPGDYTLVVVRPDHAYWREAIHLDSGMDQWEVSVSLPEADAQVSGRLVGDPSPGVFFWRSDRAVAGVISPREDDSYSIEALPPGRYRVGSYSALLHDGPGMAEFALRKGQQKVLELDVSGNLESRLVPLLVQAADELGGICRSADVHLSGPGGDIEPVHIGSEGMRFMVAVGEYVLSVRMPGFKKVQKSVTVKPARADGQPQVVVVCLERQ